MITVYTTTTCAYCKMVKTLLDAKEVKYETVNLDEHPERQQEAVDLSGQIGVPVTTNGTDVVVGFNPKQLMEII